MLKSAMWQEKPSQSNPCGALVEFPPNDAIDVGARSKNTQGAEEQKRDVMIWYRGSNNAQIAKEGYYVFMQDPPVAVSQYWSW